jgi:hypothetical protein
VSPRKWPIRAEIPPDSLEKASGGCNASLGRHRVWESDDCVRRTVVLPTELAERLAAEAERRGLSVSDLLIEYADEGLGREGAGG